ncbi:hypothetical protein CMK11_03180 [Candidatus Poribacteria bacterium]|nr:hypothetical protein [Candidatus Poribacteria bacterium]
MDTWSDEALVQASRRGSGDAFATLARRHWDCVFSVAYASLPHHASAEDVAQETFLRAYTRLGQLRSPQHFRAWICRIAVSYARAHRRTHREVITDVADTLAHTPAPRVGQEAYERQEDVERLVTDALGSLPASLRTPVVMRYMSEASYEAIAERLSTSPDAVRMRVHRGLRALRAYFTQRGLDDDCRDVLRARLVATPIGLEYVSDLIDVARRALPAAPSAAVPRAAMFAPGVAGAGLLALTLLGGVKGPVSPGVSGMSQSVTLVGARYPAGAPGPGGGVPFSAADASLPAGATLIHADGYEATAPGEPLRGWTAGVSAQTSDVPPGGGARAAAVNTNIPAAYLDFPPVRGEVTIELWMKPHQGPDANMLLRVGLARPGARPRTEQATARDDDLSAALLVKNDQDRWHYMTAYHPTVGSPPGLAQVPFARSTSAWAHFRIVYDTTRNVYDLYMDHRLVVADIPSPRDYTDGLSYITLSSGRHEYREDVPSYFDGLRIYVQPIREAAPT